MNARPGETQLDNPSSYKLLSLVRLGYFLVLSLMYLFIQQPLTPWITSFVIGSMLIFVINHFLYQTMKPSWRILLVLALDTAVTAAYGYVFLNQESPDLLFMGLSGLYFFIFIQSRAASVVWYGFFACNVVVLMAIQLHKYGRIEGAYYIVNGSFVVFACLVGSLIRYYKQSRLQTVRLHGELERSYKQLNEYALQVEELSVSRERIRIAREIHDTVGHHLTALLIQMELVRKLQDIDPPKGRESLRQCEELVRSVLRDVRLSVRTIREEERQLTVGESLGRLSGQFAEMTGMTISVDVDPEADDISGALHLTLIRIVQESLTNAQKHGAAAHAWVTLEAAGGSLDLRIRNDGARNADIQPGFGLLNMKERVREHGGSLRIDSRREDGFEIYIALPLVGQPEPKEAIE